MAGDVYERVMDLARRRGFVWPTSEAYGAVAGFIDYGPLGAMMKRRIEDTWRNFFVIREGFYEIECPTIGQEAIYVASGHVKGFTDKMFQCPHCGEFFRADHVVENGGHCEHAAALDEESLARELAEIPCPVCNETIGEVTVFGFSLMFRTSIGPGSQRTGYLRPETAQGIFTDFARLLRFYRDKLPFGVTQIGKSYRNEISPRQGMIRLREFTQAEAEIFVHPDRKEHPDFDRYADYRMPLLGYPAQLAGTGATEMSMAEAVRSGTVANEYVAYYLALTHEFLMRVGISPDRLRFRQHLPDERAHYAEDCWDAECLSDRFGWVETVGIADRTDYDLRAHASHSGEPFTVFIQYPEPIRRTETRVVPRMGALGPRFRGSAKAIAEAIAATDPASIPGDGGFVVTVGGNAIEIGPELYDVREVEVEVQGEEVMPHVIEPSYGIDRILYSILEHSFGEEQLEDGSRTVLHLPPAIAPIQVAVFPLMSRDGMDGLALEIVRELKSSGLMAEYDDSGAIGRRYRRQDEIGTPFAVTVDYDSLEDGTVTLRDRDTMRQVRLPRSRLALTCIELCTGRLRFNDLE
ncbi:MAG TPA: glycine--tRNA ligase [Methanoregulaceae archaeon]|nr:glycine--tRNA ligase [Methanoregulaceae archaeon]